MMLATHMALVALLALMLSAVNPPARAAGEACLDDWTEAAEIVRRERLATVAELTARARQAKVGTVLKTQLCEENGSYAYRLIVRSLDGIVRPIVVDARDPFVQAHGKHD